jgi:hypothetical protein
LMGVTAAPKLFKSSSHGQLDYIRYPIVWRNEVELS